MAFVEEIIRTKIDLAMEINIFSDYIFDLTLEEFFLKTVRRLINTFSLLIE